MTAVLTSLLFANEDRASLVLLVVSLLAAEDVLLLFVRAEVAADVREERSRPARDAREDVTFVELLWLTRLFEPRTRPAANSL